MGTAVLFPQDCLPISKSRYRSDLSDPFVGSPIACKSTLQFFDTPCLYPSQARDSFTTYHGIGQLYLGHARHSFAPFGSNTLQRPVEQRKPKFSRLRDEPRAASSAAIPAAGVPALTVLRRPQEKEVAKELIAGLLTKSDANRCTSRVSESRLGNGLKSVHTVVLDRKKKNGSNGKKSIDSEMARAKFRGCKLGQPKFDDSDLSMWTDLAIGDRCKPPNVMMGVVKGRSSCENRYDVLTPRKGPNEVSDLQFYAEHQSLRTMKEVKYSSSNAMNGYQPSRENAVGGGLTRLRRASTDPQIVEHLAPYRSQLLEITSSQAKSCHGFTRSTSMSLPERWAGPAYFSSPAPSSLPLPKFTLLGHKTGSLKVSPLLGEQQRSNVTKAVDLGSGSVEGDLDVAFATKSLRRILKLDPS